MSARAWVVVGVGGFWMALLGLLLRDGGLAAIGVTTCLGGVWVALGGDE